MGPVPWLGAEEVPVGSSGGGAGAGTEKAADAGNPEGGKDTIKIAVYSDFAGIDL